MVDSYTWARILVWPAWVTSSGTDTWVQVLPTVNEVDPLSFVPPMPHSATVPDTGELAVDRIQIENVYDWPGLVLTATSW